MKQVQNLCLLLFLLASAHIFAQTTSEESTKDELGVFSPRERDSMQIWFYNRATAMGLNDETRDEYYNIILYHTYKMKRLGKKDEKLSTEEMRSGFDTMLKKQHSEVKAILNEDQYDQYLKKYELIIKSVYERNGWDRK